MLPAGVFPGVEEPISRPVCWGQALLHLYLNFPAPPFLWGPPCGLGSQYTFWGVSRSNAASGQGASLACEVRACLKSGASAGPGRLCGPVQDA